MHFSISQIARAADLQPGLLSAETAAFLLLSMTEDPTLALQHPDPARLLLAPGGAVCAQSLDSATPLQVDRELRHLLRRLLLVSVGVNPRLKAVAEGEGSSLTAFRADLSQALIPINRPAAQRALLRLHRRVGEVLGQTRDEAQAIAPPVRAESPPLAVAGLPSRRAGRRPPPPPFLLNPPLPHQAAAAPAASTPSAHQSWPAATMSFASMPEIPESVTPFLGSLELEDCDIGLPVRSDWSPEPEALTDATARVSWETDGASVRVELKPEPRTELTPEVREHVLLDAFPEPAPDVFDETTEAVHLTMQVGSLPPTAERPSDVDEAAASDDDEAAASDDDEAAASDDDEAAASDDDEAAASSAPHQLPSAEPSPLSPYLDDFRPSVSDISDLLRDFAPPSGPTATSLEHSLRHFTDANEHSRTPPPVFAEAQEPASNELQRRSSVFAWLASAAVVTGALAWRFSPVVSSELASSVSAPEVRREAAAVQLPPSCSGQVRVETEPRAQVQLIEGSKRSSLPGPLAIFNAVACDGDLRVVVHLPDTNRAGDDAEWLQVPVPQAGLRLAAETGEPVVLRVFPRTRPALGRSVP
jgi:hypothetical protein